MSKKDQNPAQDQPDEEEEEEKPEPVTTLTKLADGIYQLTLLEPVFSPQMIIEITTHLDDLEELKPQLISLITTCSHPTIFGGGINLHYFDTHTREEVNSFYHNFARLLARFVIIGFPTIAAIHGYCIGFGFMFAMAHDFRYMADTPGRYLAMPEVDIGISFAFGHLSLFKEKLEGKVVEKLILGGHKFYKDEALAADIVQKVAPAEKLVETCKGLMEKLSPKSIHSGIMSSIKFVLYEDIVDDCRLRFHMDQDLLDYFVKVKKDTVGILKRKG